MATLEAAMERGTWMTAEQARDFGLVDTVAGPQVELPPIRR